MRGYVVDASVAVKWLVTEDLSDESESLLGTGVTLVAPELIFAEAANALWAMYRRGDIGSAELSAAVDLLRAAPVATPIPMRRLAPAATRLAADLDHPVYDCFYLSLAIQEQHPVVKADTRFHAKVHAHPYLSDHIIHVVEAAA